MIPQSLLLLFDSSVNMFKNLVSDAPVALKMSYILQITRALQSLLKHEPKHPTKYPMSC